MFKTHNILATMIIIRMISSLIELTAAYLMYYFNSIETAIRINAILGLIGPLILMFVTFIGLIGVTDQLNLNKLLLISLGVILIFIGTR